MLKQAQKDRLKQLGIDPEALIKAATDEAEVDIALPEGTLLTDEKIAELKANVKKGHEEAYPEIFGKQLNEELALGLSTTDAKNHKKVIEAIQKKTIEEAKIEPAQKVKELQESIKNLQEKVIPEYEGKAKDWESKYKQRERFDEYAKLIPKDANPVLTTEEHVARIERLYELGENGTIIDKKSGQPVKDTLEKARDRAEVIAETYKSNDGWLKSADNNDKSRQFHHSTNAAGHNTSQGKGFTYDKAIASLNEKYDRTDPTQRAQYMQELTTLQVNHAQDAA